MKASIWTASLAAAAAFAASAPSFAEVGLFDGQDQFTDFQSTKSRGEVQQEYIDAREQGSLPRGDAERWLSESRPDIGARGPAGSRYQARTREEVVDELSEYQRTHRANDPSDLYFGD